MTVAEIGLRGRRTVKLKKLNYSETVASEVRSILGRRMVSQRELARALNVSPNYMSRRIRGELPFDIEELMAIARLLDIPITELVDQEGDFDPVSSVRARNEGLTSATRRTCVQGSMPSQLHLVAA